MSFTEEFGARVKEARKYHGFTVKELAEKAGISASYLYKIERGQASPVAGVLVGLAIALEVSADFLVNGGSTAEENISFRRLQKLMLRLPEGKQEIAVETVKKSAEEIKASNITSQESSS